MHLHQDRMLFLTYQNFSKLVLICSDLSKLFQTCFLGKIITEILQHLHACNNSVKVFYGRVGELKCLREYICGESTMPFVLYGAGGSGKTAMISIAAAKGLQEWLKPAKPLLIVRYIIY